MGYKILGFVVWNGGKWYLRTRARALASPRTLVVGGAVGLGLAALVLGGKRAGSS
jgi:hypothetical protein